MKKSYNRPEILNITFKAEDIITESPQLMKSEFHAGGASSKHMESTWDNGLNA